MTHRMRYCTMATKHHASRYDGAKLTTRIGAFVQAHFPFGGPCVRVNNSAFVGRLSAQLGRSLDTFRVILETDEERISNHSINFAGSDRMNSSYQIVILTWRMREFERDLSNSSKR